MQKKKEAKVERTDDNIMKIALSFFGACENLNVLEREYLIVNKITFPQYANYLSQVAVCIELGMKSILINEGDFSKTHDIKELYHKLPVSFQKMFENNPFPKKTIEKSLEKIKNAFMDFRYMNTENLDFFVEKSIFTPDKHVLLSEVRRLQNFNFVIILLDKILEFYNFINSCIDKKSIFRNITNKQISFKKKNDELMDAIKKYNEKIKTIQISSYATKS